MIEIRLMKPTDLPLGRKLTGQAGWNQIDADWRRFMGMQPGGCFVAELDGAPVGTTVTCIFGPVAWIAMVLVEASARRKGVATSLLKHALEFLDAEGVTTVRLDATAAGRPVYERLGFAAEYPLTRYEGIAPPTEAQPGITTAAPSLFSEIVAFDCRMMGTHREKMLLRLFEESPHAAQVFCRDSRVEGYVTTRRGANATQIGPCIATDNAGPPLLKDALSHCAGRPVFIDIPQDNALSLEVAQTAGLKAQRHFMRMCRGDRIADSPRTIWAGSGPEKG
jgi:GNAT superfamily N-acetyltransferase